MDRIVMTDLAKSYFDIPKEDSSLPHLKQPCNPSKENITDFHKQSQGSLSVLSLRRLLKDESVSELQKLK